LKVERNVHLPLLPRTHFAGSHKDCHSFAGAESFFERWAPTRANKQIPPIKEQLFYACVGQLLRNLFDDPMIG
jgi:hypothetical protein